MRCLEIAIVIVAAPLLLAAPAAAQSPAQSPPQGDGHFGNAFAEVIDLSFRGGSAVEYVQAVRRAVGDVNIVVRPEVEHVRMEPVELKRVTIPAALMLLDGLTMQGEGRAIQLHVDLPRSHLGGDLPVYVVNAKVAGRRLPDPVAMSRVWSLALALKGRARPEDVLTAVETSLGLFGEGYGAAEMRFHAETELLIARGHPDQIEAIGAVVEELAVATAATDRRERAEQMDTERAEQIQRLQDQVEEAGHHMDQMRREVVEWRTRAELYEREAEMQRVARDEAERAVSELTGRVRALEQRLAERDAG